MHSPLDTVGQSYKGFIITKHLILKELQSTLIELIHGQTGARVMHIANDDPENLFCLSFQTLPTTSNGIAHILEHTVLCGSKKFPVKDPFFAMMRRSLNTYMNALTGQDFTCYPASSQVEKDFYNLLEVYLDAVFQPELKKLSFLQEGHRVEFTDGALQFQGIVYNEMKGAMSSPDSRLSEAVTKALFPDLTYGVNSGGDPKEIPNLTYEELVEFHRDFYHPSRCLFFFYGNLPLVKHLDFIENQALSQAGKIAPLPPLLPQPRFTAPRSFKERYPVAKGESKKKKVQVAFAWLTAPSSHQAEILALCLLDSLLTDTDASPLKRALLKSGLCTQVDSSIDVELSEIPWEIVCKGCEEKDVEKLRELIFKTLEEFASQPIPEAEIEASLHQLEFQRTEIGAEGGPFGLTLFIRAALLKQHGNEPENALLIHSLFIDLRQRLKNPDYLPHLLQKYLIQNPHFVQITLLPDPNLAKEEEAEEKRRLQAMQESLTEKEKEEILRQAKELATYQEEVEHQSLDCLPKVVLNDVPPHPRQFPLHQSSSGPLTIYQHDCFTNQILYADLLFDLPDLKREELPLVALFSRLVPELGSGGRSYEETLHYQHAYIGGFDASLSVHAAQENPNICRPSFSLRGKALYHNSEKLFNLFIDTVSSTDFTDRGRIREWLEQHATELQNRLTRSALHYAVQTSLSGFTTSSHVFDQWHGLPYYRSVLKWVKEFDETFLRSLQKIQEKVLGLQKPTLILSCDQAYFSQLQKGDFFDLGKRLPHRPFTAWEGAYEIAKVEPQARFIAAPVAFTAQGMHTVSYTDPRSAYLFIATELFGNLILHKEIREKGGAYGGGATYSPSTGNFHFYSLRDPHLAKTIATFKKALEKIAASGFNDRELEEAKLGVIQALDAPVAPEGRAMVAYSWHRAGRTLALREEFRKRILSATQSDVADAVRELLLPQTSVLVTFLGQDLFNKEEKKLKSALTILPIE